MNRTYLAFIISFLSGFLSLSQEILWVRLISFIHVSVPQSFAFVLGMYLLGIALGALWGKAICEKHPGQLAYACGWLLIGAATFDVVTPFLIVWTQESLWSLFIQMGVVILSAAIRGAVFPIVHHMGSENKARLGTSISNVYFGNVLGATLGPLLTGFILLDLMSLQNAILFIGVLSLITAFLCFLAVGRKPLSLLAGTYSAALVALIMVDSDRLALLMTTDNVMEHGKPKYIIQNKHGIIHVYPNVSGDIVYGGNLYDGRTNMHLLLNSNGIHRAYMIPLLQPHIKRLLIIGLSSGSWARILTSIPSVERIDIIEINPGYINLINRYPDIQPLLNDPRVHVYVDDGRRWLNRHPGEQYDFVLMNTTWHWRSYISNLLSIEFLNIVKSHLTPQGILYYNTTSSNDAHYTASKVFKYTYRYANFVGVSDFDFRARVHSQDNQALLGELHWPENQRPVLDMTNPAMQSTIQHMIQLPLIPIESFERYSNRPLEVITDANMITEYKFGHGFGY